MFRWCRGGIGAERAGGWRPGSVPWLTAKSPPLIPISMDELRAGRPPHSRVKEFCRRFSTAPAPIGGDGNIRTSRCVLSAHGNLMPFCDPVPQQASNQNTAAIPPSVPCLSSSPHHFAQLGSDISSPPMFTASRPPPAGTVAVRTLRDEGRLGPAFQDALSPFTFTSVYSALPPSISSLPILPLSLGYSSPLGLPLYALAVWQELAQLGRIQTNWAAKWMLLHPEEYPLNSAGSSAFDINTSSNSLSCDRAALIDWTSSAQAADRHPPRARASKSSVKIRVDHMFG
ncbi:unnamed protein product [Pleuronectes platessa]|uniref:Uncharacterized protein n=1 Tax=Pleuronectes platessa TaxID=8262 RepID=A0A9N7YU02_PLEPL|nr:unnamed protein product [Pleuronectes platessa]